MPICWSNTFSLEETDLNKNVYVAGWGRTGDPVCTTNKDGPAPYSKCKKPFNNNGISNWGCSHTMSPSNSDRSCKRLKDYMRRRRRDYEESLNRYDFIRIKRYHRGDLRIETDCYSMKPSRFGWCGTCNPTSTRPGDPGYCQVNPGGRYHEQMLAGHVNQCRNIFGQ